VDTFESGGMMLVEYVLLQLFKSKRILTRS